MIPKIIHYCWFGKKPETKLMKKCIESWKKNHPDYKVKRWDEANSPLKEEFLANALNCKKWSVASDFVRYYAVYKEGGLYFDTDVEVAKSFDPFLGEKCFFGFQSNCAKGCPQLDASVAGGVFGAEKNNPFIKELLEELSKNPVALMSPFLSGPSLVSKLLVKKGLKEYADYPFKIAGITLFPLQYFYPWPTNKPIESYGSNTYCIHHWAAGWIDSEDFFTRAKVFLFRLKRRLLH